MLNSDTTRTLPASNPTAPPPIPQAWSATKPTSRTARMLAPAQIMRDADFAFRHEVRPDRAFTRTLAQALRTGGALDPILVSEEEDDGVLTGRLILLDGAHRLAGYRSVRGPDCNQMHVPAVVLSGNRKVATLAALRANSRESLPLTLQERADAAWRLVRNDRSAFTVPETANASGVSPRTVDAMRRRWKSMQAATQQPTGAWWQDRQDAPPDRSQEPEMTDEQRAATKNELANAMRKALGTWPNRDSGLVAEALRAAIGNRELRSMTEWLYGAGEDDEDEFYTAPIVGHTGTAVDPLAPF